MKPFRYVDGRSVVFSSIRSRFDSSQDGDVLAADPTARGRHPTYKETPRAGGTMTEPSDGGGSSPAASRPAHPNDGIEPDRCDRGKGSGR